MATVSPGAAQGPKRYGDRLVAARGDDDLVGRQRATGLDRPLGDLVAQRFVAVREDVGDARCVLCSHDGEKDAVELFCGQKLTFGVAMPRLTKAGLEASFTMTRAISLIFASAGFRSALESCGSVTGISRGGET